MQYIKDSKCTVPLFSNFYIRETNLRKMVLKKDVKLQWNSVTARLVMFWHTHTCDPPAARVLHPLVIVCKLFLYKVSL